MLIELIVAIILTVVIGTVIAGVIVAITMPFIGAMVRWRANYNPKAVELDGEGDGKSSVGPALTSLWGTLKRVKRLEGWYGLYKGAYASLAFNVIIITLSAIIFGTIAVTLGDEEVPELVITPAVLIGFSVFAITLTALTLPFTIIVNRSIVTPYRLPSEPFAALAIILSPPEMERFYRLYLTPGLLLVTCIQTASVALIGGLVKYLLVGSMPGLGSTWQGEPPSPIRIILLIAFQALSTAWLVPLSTIATRLSVQPYSPRGDHYSVIGQDGADDVDVTPPNGLAYCGDGEDVISLRPVTEPYLGMVDCARKVVREEGTASLFRGWMWSGWGNIFDTFGG